MSKPFVNLLLLRLHLEHLAFGGGEGELVAVHLNDVIARRQRGLPSDRVEVGDLLAVLRRHPRRLPLQSVSEDDRDGPERGGLAAVDFDEAPLAFGEAQGHRRRASGSPTSTWG